MVGIKSDVGVVRSLNEDYASYIEEEDYKLYIVADGMGGHNAGEVASEMAVNAVKLYVKDNYKSDGINVLENAIIFANEKIYDKARCGSEYKGMGTTLVAAFVYEDNVIVANVGDSSCFGIIDNDIIKITKDHSLVQELIDSGSITEEEGRNHPKKNVITRALGTNNIVKVDIFKIDINTYDKYLLCTDGLSGYISDERIREVLHNIDDNTEVLNTLIADVYDAGAGDNVTIIVGTI